MLFYAGRSQQLHDSLFAYEAKRGVWRQLPLADAPQQAATKRELHTSCYDPISGQMLIVGGCDEKQRPCLDAHAISFKHNGI